MSCLWDAQNTCYKPQLNTKNLLISFDETTRHAYSHIGMLQWNINMPCMYIDDGGGGGFKTKFLVKGSNIPEKYE